GSVCWTSHWRASAIDSPARQTWCKSRAGVISSIPSSRGSELVSIPQSAANAPLLERHQTATRRTLTRVRRAPHTPHNAGVTDKKDHADAERSPRGGRAVADRTGKRFG